MIPTYDDGQRPTTRLGSRRHLPFLLPALLTALLLAVSACGSTSSSTTATDDPTTSPTSSAPTTPPTTPPTSTAPAETVPACTEVWVAGEVLPGSYRGCMNDSGKKVRARPIYCEQGNRLYLYGGQFWALADKPVHLSKQGLKNDPVFRAFVRTCTE
jgi:hypothetical protein